jgi:hypothetical protein
VVLAWARDTGAPLEKTNVNGGAIALGHPLGATGAVLATKLVYELHRSGGRYGLRSMCEGGGQATPPSSNASDPRARTPRAVRVSGSAPGAPRALSAKTRVTATSRRR